MIRRVLRETEEEVEIESKGSFREKQGYETIQVWKAVSIDNFPPKELYLQSQKRDGGNLTIVFGLHVTQLLLKRRRYQRKNANLLWTICKLRLP